MQKKIFLHLSVCFLFLFSYAQAQEVSADTLSSRDRGDASNMSIHMREGDVAKKITDYLNHKNNVAAFDLASKYASDDSPGLIGMLGLMYIGAIGTDKSVTTGMQLLKRSADLGNAYSALMLGDIFYLGTDVPVNKSQALLWYKKSAVLGNDVAQDHVGQAYGLGVVYKKDRYLSDHWLHKSIMQGNADAEMHWVFFHLMPHMTEEQNKQVFYLSKDAAEKGNTMGMNAVAYLYLNGVGTPKNPVLAYKWVSISVLSGMKEADILREKMDKQLDQDDIDAGQRLAQQWYKEHPDFANKTDGILQDDK